MGAARTRFTTEILDQALGRERESREDLRKAVRNELFRALAESPIKLKAAIIFGSIVRPGHFEDDSDIDLAVPYLEPRAYFTLKSYLEQRMRREVDLLDIDTCHFAVSIRRDGLRWISPDT